MSLFSYGRDVELVIHAAAQPSHDWAAKEPRDDFDINAVGTLNVLEATRLHAPEAVFIFTSTNKVYGDTPNSLPFVELDTRWEIEPGHTYADGIREDMSIDGCLHSLFGASKVAADVLVQEYGRYFGMRTACFRGGTLTGAAPLGDRAPRLPRLRDALRDDGNALHRSTATRASRSATRSTAATSSARSSASGDVPKWRRSTTSAVEGRAMLRSSKRAKARRAPGCTNGSAGTLLEEHVAQPKGGRLLVFLGSTRLELEGIGVGISHGQLQRDRRLCGRLLPQ